MPSRGVPTSGSPASASPCLTCSSCWVLGCLESVQATIQSVHSASEHRHLWTQGLAVGVVGVGAEPPPIALLCGCSEGVAAEPRKLMLKPLEAPGPAWGGVLSVMGLGLDLPFHPEAPASWAGLSPPPCSGLALEGQLSNPGLPRRDGVWCSLQLPPEVTVGSNRAGVWGEGLGAGSLLWRRQGGQLL